MPHKVRKLVVHGPKDSGKTTSFKWQKFKDFGEKIYLYTLTGE